MRYSTKRKVLKYTIGVAIALVVILINIWIFFIIQPVTKLEKQMVELNCSVYSKVYPYEDGLVVVDQKELIWYDKNGKEELRVDLPKYDMQAYRSGNATVVWDSETALIYNEKGVEILTKYLVTADSEILFGRTSEDYFVLATIEEEQYKARIYDYEANEVSDMLFPYQSMMNLGFFGSTGKQLWVLLLDSHGTIPITKVRTDHPGKSMTGSISILNQVCYDIIPLRDVVYIVGTHHIQSYSYTSVKETEQLVYGWTMQDYVVDDQNISFLMGTTQSGEYESPISALWYIGSDENQFRVSLPNDISDAVMTKENIYAIGDDEVYVYDIAKQRKSFDKLSFIIEEVMGTIPGEAVVLKGSDHIYLLPLK